MKSQRKLLNLALAGALGATALAAGPALASDAPLRVLVGFPAGGATDIVARILAEPLSRELGGRTVIVENRAGAGGQIATQYLKNADPDGNTVMLTIDHSQVIIPLTITSAEYDPVADFTALGGVAQYYNALGVRGDLGIDDMGELREWLAENPAEANIGVPAAGSVPQFAVHLLGESIGIDLNSVPYKGGAPLVQDVVGGHVTGGVASLTDLFEQHKAGRVRVLATSGEQRNQTLPEVPTFAESGVEGIEMNPWLAFFGPAGLSTEFVQEFNTALNTVLAQPQVEARLAEIGNEVSPTTPEELQQWVSDATAHWGDVIERAGFEPQ